MTKGVCIHWYRKGLRIHDNPALLAAISACYEENLELCPLFILDTWIIKKLRVGPNRWRFLQQSLCDLDSNLRNIGSRLYVLRGTPEDTFRDKFREWNVKVLTFEVDIEPYARERDECVMKLANTAGVKVIQKISHTLYDPDCILHKNMGKAPLTYQKLLSLIDIIGAPKHPVESPSKISDSIKLNIVQIDEDDHCVPTLAELGVDEAVLTPTIFPGGESAALKRLSQKMANKDWVRKFEKPNTSPNSLEPSTTVLSPYLKFGCLSARTFYYKLKEVLGNSLHTKPPVSLVGQLLWREFYYVVASVTPNFDKMVGNPICCQVPWNKNEHHLAAWAEGKTGYPFIDAIMIQLRTEGWIHHLARHAVACFLTRGDLWISWEDGQKVFEELLLDADWALNAGNWLWLSASAFFHQFFRVYSPVAFGKKTDKLGEYIKKYIPVLRKFPPDYVYEPWKAPLSVQKQAGCIVGKDYPTRIVIHEDVYKNNISKMSDAYKSMKGQQHKQESELSTTTKNKKIKTTK